MKNKRNRQMPVWKTFVQAVAVFAGLLASLYLLAVLFATVPNRAIADNMLQSARYEMSVENVAIPEDGSLRQVADNHADQIWLSIAWYMGEGDPFTAVLDTGYYDGDNFGVAVGLRKAVVQGLQANKEYLRYWHGSAALLRITHIFTDIQGSKILGMLCLLVLVGVTLLRLWQQGYRDLAMCLAASLLAIQPMQLGKSFEYLPSFLICFGFCPAFLKWEKRGDSPLVLLSVAAGVMTAFFDFLTTETVTVLVPLILVVAVRSLDGRITSKQDTAKLLISCLALWAIAYVGTFAAKWIAAELVLGKPQLTEALESAGQRVDGQVLVNGQRKTPGPLLGIVSNLAVLLGGDDRSGYGRVLFILVILGIFVYRVIREKAWRKAPCRGTGFVLALGMSVFLRFAILPSHAYLHAFFTYRALMSTLLAILTALMLNLCPRRRRKRRDRKTDPPEAFLP